MPFCYGMRCYNTTQPEESIAYTGVCYKTCNTMQWFDFKFKYTIWETTSYCNVHLSPSQQGGIIEHWWMVIDSIRILFRPVLPNVKYFSLLCFLVLCFTWCFFIWLFCLFWYLLLFLFFRFFYNGTFSFGSLFIINGILLVQSRSTPHITDILAYVIYIYNIQYLKKFKIL